MLRGILGTSSAASVQSAARRGRHPAAVERLDSRVLLAAHIGANDYPTIQAAIDAATAGDTITVDPTVHNERLVVNKNGLKIIGAGIDATVVDYTGQTAGQGGVYITGNNVELRNLTVTHSSPNTASVPRYGIKTDFVTGSSTLPVDGLVIDSVKVSNSFRTGIDLNGVTNVTLNDVSAINNGGAGIFMTDVKGASLSNITTAGNPWTGVSIATFGRFFPLGTNGIVFSGSNSFGESATPNGAGQSNGGMQFEMGNFFVPASPKAISFSNQAGDGADVTIQSADFAYMVGGVSDNANVYRRFYQTLAEAQTAALGTPDHIVAGQRFIQDADDSNGFAPRVTNFYVYDNPGTNKMSVQAAINAAVADDVVNVAAGTYVEDVVVNKSGLSLLGDDASTTTISGAIGGDGATVRVAANNVEVAGFTITREGNNTTDWNNPGLNFAGIAVQGLAVTGMDVHDNVLVGNRTGIDVNNSNGHNIHNNDISDNRTGLIFRNQTDNLTVVENKINDNWTVGVLFLDASGGTNSPVQSALNSTFCHNDVTGNWYGGVVDRQAGGSLPAPGTTNLKDFRGNYFGTSSPVVTTAHSTEPGYAAQIPVAFGGTAVAPGGQPDIAGAASANIVIAPWLLASAFSGNNAVFTNNAGASLSVNTATGEYLFIDNGVKYFGTGARVAAGVLKIHDQSSAGKLDATGDVDDAVTVSLKGKGKPTSYTLAAFAC